MIKIYFEFTYNIDLDSYIWVYLSSFHPDNLIIKYLYACSLFNCFFLVHNDGQQIVFILIIYFLGNQALVINFTFYKLFKN